MKQVPPVVGVVTFALFLGSLSFSPSACSSRQSSGTASDAGRKLPSVAEGKAAGTGKRGGSGSLIPGPGSPPVSSRTTSSPLKTPMDTENGSHPCRDVPDGRAQCGAGTEILFCAAGQLYKLDCSLAMTTGDAAFPSGACFETEGAADCFGCGTADDGSNVCCLPSSTGPWLCCDDNSNCAEVSP